jgi:FKBP-type peptidyl-prolyl cis-trans isomerase FklB
MKKVFKGTVLGMLAFAGVAMISCNAQTPKANLKTDVDSLSYALGINIVHNQGLAQYLLQMGIDSTCISEFIKGFNEGFNLDKDDKKANARTFGLQIGQQIGTQMVPDMNQNFFGEDTLNKINKNSLSVGLITALLNKKLLIEKDSIQAYLTEVKKTLFEKQHAQEKADNLKFLEENKSKEGVITLPSGLQYKVITEGKGAKPTASDKVKVDYTGTTIDGKEFDSSAKAGKPAEFPLRGVIAGWTEGIQLMPVGSKYIFYIPYDLAYGEQGRAGAIPPFATLIFEVELHEILKEAQK